MKRKSSQQEEMKKRNPLLFVLSLPLISLIYSRSESDPREERDAWLRNGTRLGEGEGKKKSSERELIQQIMETDSSREWGPDFTVCCAEIDGLLHNRERLCARSKRTRLFAEFIHVKRPPTIWPEAWHRARCKGNTWAWGLITKWVGGKKSSPHFGQQATPVRLKRWQERIKQVTNFW